jgi:hypothetical protein
MSEVVKIEATRTRLFLVVVVVGVAFCTACFLERLLRDYLLIDKERKVEPREVSGSLPKWLNRNRGKGERRAELRTAFVTPTVNALSFWEDNWLSLAQVPLVVAWQPKLISKDEVLRIAANIAKLPELFLKTDCLIEAAADVHPV